MNRCVAYIDLATCCLLLQASSIEPPTKASFEAYGDCGLILMEHQLKSVCLRHNNNIL